MFGFSYFYLSIIPGIYVRLTEWEGGHMSFVMRKPVFGVSDQVRLKPACAATKAARRLKF